MTHATILGLDIGGANLKISDGHDWSQSVPFALWREPQRLADELRKLIELAPHPLRGLAVTMTGELADCFVTKAEGVRRILEAVESAGRGCPIGVWQTSGEFVPVEIAIDEPRLTAAANWHALATWAGQLTGTGWGLLIDIGSTTCDLIPINQGLPDPTGRTDLERLLSGELVYTGVRRTPLCCVKPTVLIQGRPCPLAAEIFSTTLDLYLITGDIPESAATEATADGRSATRSAALNRVARQMCCDCEELSAADIAAVAQELVAAQLAQLQTAASRVIREVNGSIQTVITAGEGEFLASRLKRAVPELSTAREFSLTTLLGSQHSQAACAFALARLAQDRSSIA